MYASPLISIPACVIRHKSPLRLVNSKAASGSGWSKTRSHKYSMAIDSPSCTGQHNRVRVRGSGSEGQGQGQGQSQGQGQGQGQSQGQGQGQDQGQGQF